MTFFVLLERRPSLEYNIPFCTSKPTEKTYKNQQNNLTYSNKSCFEGGKYIPCPNVPNKLIKDSFLSEFVLEWSLQTA